MGTATSPLKSSMKLAVSLGTGLVALLMVFLTTRPANNSYATNVTNASTLAPSSYIDLPPYFSSGQLSLGTSKVAFSSPTLADLNGDGKLDIIVGTSDGYLIARSGADGSQLWKQSVKSYFSGFNDCGTDTPINSTPAVGYFRKPLSATPVLGVVVGVGGILSVNGNGGVIAFDKNGNFLWVKFTRHNKNGGINNCDAGVWASPTVADLDKDGRNEILFGGFDNYFYVLHDDGTDYSPWPIKTLDTDWSSPAVGDIDNDGQLDIVSASDVGLLNHNCPYSVTWGYDYCGGSVSVRHLDGSMLPGFPYYSWQAMRSDPVLADINNDGYLDIIVGSGTYYNTSKLTPNTSFIVQAIDHTGNSLPGWPVALQGVTDGEPVVADLNKDGKLEVVMGTGDYYCFQDVYCPTSPMLSGEIGGLYAIWPDGNNHSGGPFMWHVQPKTSTDKSSNASPAAIRAPMIADIDGDGNLDVIFSMSQEVQVVNGQTGSPKIGGAGNTTGSRMSASGQLLSAAAVGDLNHDGHLEVIAAGAYSHTQTQGAIYVWEITGTVGIPYAPWPMYRRTPFHSSLYIPPKLNGTPDNLGQIRAISDPLHYTYIIPLKVLGDETLHITTALNKNPACGPVQIQPSTPLDLMPDQTQNITITLDLTGCNSLGENQLGSITLTASYNNGILAANSPQIVGLTSWTVTSVQRNFLPVITH